MFKKLTKLRLIKKTISIFVITAFLFSDSSFAMNLMPLHMSANVVAPFEEFLNELSYENAGIERVRHFDRESSPQIIHIQDAHANPQAQEQIYTILKRIHQYAQKQKTPLLIALEGAQGSIHPEYLDFFKNDLKINDLIVKDLLGKGELSGAELFAWDVYKQREQQTDEIFFAGVEDVQSYRDNYLAYQKITNNKEITNKIIAKIYTELFSTVSKELNVNLLNFIKMRQKYKLGKHDLSTGVESEAQLSIYLEALFQLMFDELKIDLDSEIEQLRFSQLTRFNKMQKASRLLQKSSFNNKFEIFWNQINSFEKSTQEKQWFKAWTSLFIEKKWLALDKVDEEFNSKISPRHLFEGMFRYLKSKNVAIEDFPEMKWAMQIIIFESELDAAVLFEEVEHVEKTLFQKMALTQAEKDYISDLYELEILEKLLRLEMTQSDFDSNLEDFFTNNF